MVKVKFIEEQYGYELEDRINQWLRMNSDARVIDIKYSGSGCMPAYSTSYYSAMIIFDN